MSKPLLSIVAAAFCIVAAGPATAALLDPTGAPKAEKADDSTAQPAAESKTRYCIRDTVTGSRVPVKVCHTRKEWLDQGFDPLAK